MHWDAALDLVDAELESRPTDESDARGDDLRLCMEKLTENARTTLRLRYFEGLRGDEVAARLGRKPDAIYKALQRAYATLQECIRRKLEKEEGIHPT